jgi:putative transposase
MARRSRPRGQAQTKGYQRAKCEAAKVAKKAQRQNVHTGRVWARRVVVDHQTIAVEDFRPRFLAGSTMARKAADAAVSTIKRTLIECAKRAGRKVVLVQPAYTTMTCNGCFARTKRLPLDERTFACPACGLIEDRDRNAAKTILAVAERGHTSVEGVRHSEPPPKVVSGAA